VGVNLIKALRTIQKRFEKVGKKVKFFFLEGALLSLGNDSFARICFISIIYLFFYFFQTKRAAGRAGSPGCGYLMCVGLLWLLH
jgi:hypothetical protein